MLRNFAFYLVSNLLNISILIPFSANIMKKCLSVRSYQTERLAQNIEPLGNEKGQNVYLAIRPQLSIRYDIPIQENFERHQKV